MSHLCWSEGRLLDLGSRVGVAELSLGRAESSEHDSTNFCAFCLSTITEYSKSCLLLLTLTKVLPKRIDTAM